MRRHTRRATAALTAAMSAAQPSRGRAINVPALTFGSRHRQPSVGCPARRLGDEVKREATRSAGAARTVMTWSRVVHASLRRNASEEFRNSPLTRDLRPSGPDTSGGHLFSARLRRAAPDSDQPVLNRAAVPSGANSSVRFRQRIPLDQPMRVTVTVSGRSRPGHTSRSGGATCAGIVTPCPVAVLRPDGSPGSPGLTTRRAQVVTGRF